LKNDEVSGAKREVFLKGVELVKVPEPTPASVVPEPTCSGTSSSITILNPNDYVDESGTGIFRLILFSFFFLISLFDFCSFWLFSPG